MTLVLVSVYRKVLIYLYSLKNTIISSNDQIYCLIIRLNFTDACTPTISGSSSIDLVVGNSHLLSCSYTSCTSKRTITWTVNGKSPSASTLTYTYSTSQNSANNTVHNGNSKFTYIPSRPSSSDPNSVKVICMAGSSTDSDSVTVNVQCKFVFNNVFNNYGFHLKIEYQAVNYKAPY